MRTFHHIGIPTDQPHENETHLSEAGVFITDAQVSPDQLENHHSIILTNSLSSSIGIFSFCALSNLEPGSAPATT